MYQVITDQSPTQYPHNNVEATDRHHQYNYLKETNTISHLQKGCRRKCWGTKDQLLIDKMVMMNSKRSMAGINYKKAFDMIPHSWLIECLDIYGAEENTIRFLKNTMPNWKTILTHSGTRLAEVIIGRGIFQGYSLSPLLFLVAMIPMAKVLERMEVGYLLKKGGSRINHLMTSSCSGEVPKRQ